MLLPLLSMVFDGSGPLVKRCDGFDGSLWSTLKFVQRIAAKNDTEMKPTRNERAFKGFVSQRFNCSRNLRTKEGKKSRQHGKSTNCPAFFTYKLYDCQKEEGIECFALKMKIEYVHNHEIQTTKAWSFLGVSKETVERYFQLF